MESTAPQITLPTAMPRYLLIALFLTTCFLAQEKPRIFVLTDISNEPDDEESLVRLLVYSNEFDVEGLVATTSTWLKTKTREDLIRADLSAYSKVRENLIKHAQGYPTKEQLTAITTTGQIGAWPISLRKPTTIQLPSSMGTAANRH
jgi:hypothetical protein